MWCIQGILDSRMSAKTCHVYKPSSTAICRLQIYQRVMKRTKELCDTYQYFMSHISIAMSNTRVFGDNDPKCSELFYVGPLIFVFLFLWSFFFHFLQMWEIFFEFFYWWVLQFFSRFLFPCPSPAIGCQLGRPLCTHFRLSLSRP